MKLNGGDAKEPETSKKQNPGWVATSNLEENWGIMFYISLFIAIFIANNWFTILWTSFRCSIMEPPSTYFIFTSFRIRKALCPSIFLWYKLFKFFHREWVNVSVDTWWNILCSNYMCLIVFLFNFLHSSTCIFFGLVSSPSIGIQILAAENTLQLRF